MKIAWFTPFSDRSAIGKFSQTISHELNSTCEVDLWAPRDVSLLSTDLRLFPFTADDDLSGKLSAYDFIIYNLGDHLGFHKDIYEISKRHRGVVILHDYMMHHFFYAYHLVQNKNPDAYIRDMNFYYGNRGNSIACDIVQGKTPPEWETEIMRYPFFEKAVEGALGVICHSFFLADKVGEKILPPACMIRMPRYQKPLPAQRLKMEEWGIPNNKLLLVTIGHVNSNKRIDRVIEYLGKHRELSEKVCYTSIGSYDHNPLIHNYYELIERYKLNDRVKLLGYQPDSVLHAFMASTDVFINMRYPVMEGGSASLVEQMSYGKPIIVTNAGHYAELPDDCVIKVRMEHEEEDFVNALSMLIDREETRVEIGRQGMNFAAQECTVQRYSRELIDYLTELEKWRPICDLTDRVARELIAMKVSMELKAVDDIADEIKKIFSTGNL